MNPSLILCPIEPGPHESAALARAAALARWYEAELHVLQVESEPPRGRDGSAAVACLAEFARSVIGDAAVEPVVMAGDPVSSVADYARTHAADLVVIAQNARRGSRYWSAGAYATALARAVTCPTLAVPADARVRADRAPFAEIVCAVALVAPSIAALNEALAIAQCNAGRIVLLHVLEGFPYEAVYSGGRALALREEYRGFVSRAKRELASMVPADATNWCEVETEAVSGMPQEAIVALADERQADLIVMGLPQRPRLDQVVAGPVVASVVRHARCPVLIVPGAPDVRWRPFASEAEGTSDAAFEQSGARRLRSGAAGRSPHGGGPSRVTRTGARR